ncbi:MAG: glycosyltransferase [Phycisphaerae bacterium]|nr:glycosyltransferase [Phycisphaerae bacterium]
MPQIILTGMTVLLCACCLAVGGFWVAVAFHVARTMAFHPTARRGLRLPAPDPAPRVCIVIPAHNEETVIGTVAASLRAQDYPAFRVVFVLDRCTDRTEDILRDALAGDVRFEVLILKACPEGWAGKVHAVHRGIADSSAARDAELLLFADADTCFDPGCVRACVSLMLERRLDMLSLLSTLTARSWFERVVQPAAAFELARQYPLLRAGRNDDRRRAFANGQFLLFRADAYRALGGHEAVHDELLEDLALARRAADLRLRAGVFLADGVLLCRMYADWASFGRGWRRIYTEGAKRKPSRLRAAARVPLLFGAIGPALVLLATLLGLLLAPGTRASALLAIGLSASVACLAGLVSVFLSSRSPLVYLPCYPLGSFLVWRILIRAARDLERGAPTVWGGRSYQRPVRR